MYLGKIVEHGPSQQLYGRPSHPYSQMLLATVPKADPRIEKHRKGPLMICEVTSPTNPPSGRRLRTRCRRLRLTEPVCTQSSLASF